MHFDIKARGTCAKDTRGAIGKVRKQRAGLQPFIHPVEHFAKSGRKQTREKARLSGEFLTGTQQLFASDTVRVHGILIGARRLWLQGKTRRPSCLS